jgi:predicted PurR-regulated permease PerM
METFLKAERLYKLTAFMVLLVVMVVIMIAGAQLLVPLTWAFLFSFVMMPLCERLERKLSRSASAIIATLVFCAVSGLIMFWLIYQAVSILQNEPVLFDKVKGGVDKLISSIEGFLDIPVIAAESPITEKNFRDIVGFFARGVSSMGENLVTVTLIPMYLFFILNYRGLWTRFFAARFQGELQAELEAFASKSQESIRNYLLGTVILTAVSAAMSFLILLAFGVSYAFFFGVFISMLNLIPYIGNLLAFAVVLLFAWVTKDSGLTVLFIGVALYAANMIQENFLRPKLVGDKMEMNAMMVFSAVVVGGMIWGFSGMVLFIPLLGILQALLNSHPAWKPFAIFFEPDEKQKLVKP